MAEEYLGICDGCTEPKLLIDGYCKDCRVNKRAIFGPTACTRPRNAITCPNCGGAKYIGYFKDVCKKCNGRGYLE